MERVCEIVLVGMFTVLTLFVVLLLAAVIAYIPAMAVAEAECLEKGYPKASVTYDFKKYCKNLEGSVTVRVESL